MAKTKYRYVCQSCGYESAKWMGKCPECGTWDSMVEEAETVQKSRSYMPNNNEKIKPRTIESVAKVEVKRLASKQLNIGRFLPEDEMGLEPGTYSFDINSRDADYEFQFNINENDTNKTIEEKLARLITKSNIGIQARTVNDEDGNIGLILESDEHGVREGSELQFKITDDKTSKANGTVAYFGLDSVEIAPENSLFLLNGEEKSTQSNKFTVEKAFEITLNGISEDGKTTQIGLKTDIESLTDNISHLIEGYNSFINKAAQYLDSQPYSGRLVKEMGSISSIYGEGLSQIGVNVNEDGTISLDKEALAKTADGDDALEKFSSIRSFTGSVLDKVNKVALNPMDYTQKTIVAYKNPGKSFVSPYVTSNYSGMMFSSYC